MACLRFCLTIYHVVAGVCISSPSVPLQSNPTLSFMDWALLGSQRSASSCREQFNARYLRCICVAAGGEHTCINARVVGSDYCLLCTVDTCTQCGCGGCEASPVATPAEVEEVARLRRLRRRSRGDPSSSSSSSESSSSSVATTRMRAAARCGCIHAWGHQCLRFHEEGSPFCSDCGADCCLCGCRMCSGPEPVPMDVCDEVASNEATVG
jgi:hypothetical protein